MWALQYALYLERRIQVEDKEAELELSCYNTNFERWQQLYQAKASAQDIESALDYGEAFDGEEEMPVTDVRDLDEWYGSLGSPRGISGGEIDQRFGELSSVLGIADGPGRRV
jgi:hypothetical protein